MVDRVGMDSTPRVDTLVGTIATTMLPHSPLLVRIGWDTKHPIYCFFVPLPAAAQQVPGYGQDTRTGGYGQAGDAYGQSYGYDYSGGYPGGDAQTAAAYGRGAGAQQRGGGAYYSYGGAAPPR